MDGVEQDLGLVLVGRDVVADLGRPDTSAPITRADREDIDDIRPGCLHRLDLRDHLRVVVIERVLGREVRGGGGGRGSSGAEEADNRRDEGEAMGAAMRDGHADRVTEPNRACIPQKDRTYMHR
jgi:hypothetical protein